jgi:hypothetical protein
MRRCDYEKMRRCEDVKMRNEKMRREEDDHFLIFFASSYHQLSLHHIFKSSHLHTVFSFYHLLIFSSSNLPITFLTIFSSSRLIFKTVSSPKMENVRCEMRGWEDCVNCGDEKI